MKALALLRPALLALVTVGCSSISSTHLERDLELCGWKKTHLHGVPITLSVPHHFRVVIIETYWEKNQNILREATPDGKGALIVTRDVQLTVEDTQEIFTVDFVKPVSGTLDTNATLDPKLQYFTSIKNTIVDTTIKDIAESVKTLSGAIKPLTGAARGIQVDAGLIRHDRVVAETFVEVADPHAREKIHDFLCQHLNGCSTCATRAGERPAAIDQLPPVGVPVVTPAPPGIAPAPAVVAPAPTIPPQAR